MPRLTKLQFLYLWILYVTPSPLSSRAPSPLSRTYAPAADHEGHEAHEGHEGTRGGGCQGRGVGAAGHEGKQGGGGSSPSPANAQEIADSLIAWVNTPTWDESRAYLEAHPALLDPATDAVLAALLTANAGNDGAVQTLQRHAALLQACREGGIAAAYARVGG